MREPIQKIDRWVLLFSLKPPNVGPIHARIERQPLLRETASYSDPS